MKTTCALWVILTFFLYGSSATGGTRYEVINLGSPEWGMYRATGINDRGQIVGSTMTSDACIWWNGTIEILESLPNGSGSCYGYGINATSTVVGNSGAATSTSHACLWDPTGIHDLGILLGGNTRSSAFGVNDNGLVVGHSESRITASDRYFRACKWDSQGVHPLQEYVPYYSEALAVNNVGQVVGWANISTSGLHATLWDSSGIHDLGALTSSGSSQAFAINDSGVSAGWSTDANHQVHACRWDKSGVNPLPLLPDATKSCAWGINKEGVIVGYSYTADGLPHACLWDNGGIQELTALPGYDYSVELAINSNGWVVGYARKDGYDSAVLWRPVPEPSSLLTLLSGLLSTSLLIRFRRR